MELRSVQFRNLPTDLWHESGRWFEELLREFTVIANSDPGSSVPRDLLAFVDEVTERFSEFGAATTREIEAAHLAGVRHLDVSQRVPAEAATAAGELWEHIAKADEFCRGGQLLIVQLSDELRAYIRWYLLEVVRQLDGAEPIPWMGSQTPK